MKKRNLFTKVIHTTSKDISTFFSVYRIPFILLIILLFCMITAFYIKGKAGDPLYFQIHNDTTVGGPFEASNSTSRYALTESIVNNHSFLLSDELARFSAPDLAYYKGKFISLFTPGVSFLGIPFYILGNLLYIPQLFTYFSTILAACINVLLIAYIAKKLGASFFTGLFAGLVFLFATNALSYALTFTQHQFSVLFILLTIFFSLKKKSFINALLLGVFFSASALIDIPNILLFIPILFYNISRYITIIQPDQKKIIVCNMKIVGIILGALPFLALFAWYNLSTAQSYTKIAQFIGRTYYFQSQGQHQPVSVPASQQGSFTPVGLHLPFETQYQLNGFYTLLISNERSWIYYSPVVYFGVLGLYILYKNEKQRKIAVVITSIILINIVMYATFSDPWGGWAFGPRYLIPAASLLCLMIAPVLERYKKNVFFVAVFFAILIYSIWINSLGALTTTAIPPKVEALSLSTHIPYTWKYNEELMQKNQTNSILYNVIFTNFMSVQTFLYILTGITSGVFVLIYIISLFEKREGSI